MNNQTYYSIKLIAINVPLSVAKGITLVLTMITLTFTATHSLRSPVEVLLTYPLVQIPATAMAHRRR